MYFYQAVLLSFLCVFWFLTIAVKGEEGIPLEYLVVAGGAGSNCNNGAGAGGLLTNLGLSKIYAPTDGTPVGVTVGAGGAIGAKGGNSDINGSIVALGGGPGNHCGFSSTSDMSGGSGGAWGGLGTPGQGHDGGACPSGGGGKLCS
jgi:hypothetical protein